LLLGSEIRHSMHPPICRVPAIKLIADGKVRILTR
jgi:hypothetical protein